jgi:hypothetical protein
MPYRSEANMFILKNLNSEAKRSKLMLNCESSEAKRTCSTVEKIISKRSEHVYIEEFEYRSEANRLDSDFLILKNEKKRTFVFFKNEGQKTNRFVSKLSKFCHYYCRFCNGGGGRGGYRMDNHLIETPLELLC